MPFAILVASLTGTAFPIWVYILFRLPVKSYSRGNVCKIAHSLALSLRILLTCISGLVAVIVGLVHAMFMIQRYMST